MQNNSPKHSPKRAAPARASAAERAVERSLAGRRTAYAEEVRRLVAAALAEIERSGELEPRVADVVRGSGLSNQAFYRHFPSKEALLVAVLDEGIRMLARYLERRMAAAATPVDRVRAWLRGMLAQALRPSGAAATRPFALGRGRLAEAYPAEVAESERQLTAPLREALRDAVAAGELPHADPEGDAESLYHLAMGWVQARLAGPGRLEASDAERLVAFAMAGLARAPRAEGE